MIVDYLLLPASKIKWFIQRGLRGWSDGDLLDLSGYLARWLPDALEGIQAIKAAKGTVPMSILKETNFELEDAQSKWHTALHSMIAGFQAHLRLIDGYYKTGTKTREHDLRVRNNGMKLFAMHFVDLWD